MHIPVRVPCYVLCVCVSVVRKSSHMYVKEPIPKTQKTNNSMSSTLNWTKFTGSISEPKVFFLKSSTFANPFRQVCERTRTPKTAHNENEFCISSAPLSRNGGDSFLCVCPNAVRNNAPQPPPPQTLRICCAYAFYYVLMKYFMFHILFD